MIAELKKTTEQKMGKSIEAFKNDLAKVRNWICAGAPGP